MSNRFYLICLSYSYPLDKIRVVVIDNASNDGTVNAIKEVYGEIGQWRIEKKGNFTNLRMTMHNSHLWGLSSCLPLRIWVEQVVSMLNSDGFLKTVRTPLFG